MSNKTGLKYLDELSPSERKHAFENARQFHNSLNEEQRVQRLEVYYRMIREKRKANPFLMHKGISDEEIIR